ncbi:ATP-dependent endonuclease [Serratia symbiotica]|uniref:ATP-dependent endonuclease n=1 Tax=Serratia symbiotica TaxID=138074 RepID=UPI0033141512
MENEFLFYNKIVLVEGPTEKIVLNHIQDKLGLELHVIDCLGKGNTPKFAKILNKFDVTYIVIYDSYSPKVRRKGKCINSVMWTANSTIRHKVSKSQTGKIYYPRPKFRR